MIKIVCISDTHKRKGFEIPDGDILIHAGDISSRGSHQEMFHEMKWLGSLRHPYKVFICGNHDWLGEKEPGLMRLLCQDNKIIYLEDSSVEILGLKIYGSPVTPWFHDWAFNKFQNQIKKYWDAIPEDTDILVTHGPPYGLLDVAPNGGSVGCPYLLEAIKRVKPKLHIFGHIHDCAGQTDYLGIKLVNASICDEDYEASNKPIVVEL